MSIQYRLSNRQRKELLVRGHPLIIALPECEISDHDEARQWAASVLPLDVREMITRVDCTSIDVAPPLERKDVESLTNILGSIVRDDDSKHWTVSIQVLLVWLTPKNPRHVISRPQWPAAVMFNGMLIPTSKESE